MIAQIQRSTPGSVVRIRLLNEDGTSRSELVVDQCEVMMYSPETDEQPVSIDVLRRGYYAALEMARTMKVFADLDKYLERR